jgi:hypothetical protein
VPSGNTNHYSIFKDGPGFITFVLPDHNPAQGHPRRAPAAASLKFLPGLQNTCSFPRAEIHWASPREMKIMVLKKRALK